MHDYAHEFLIVATALVAAKRIYFEVGGGGDEFLKVLEELGGESTK